MIKLIRHSLRKGSLTMFFLNARQVLVLPSSRPELSVAKAGSALRLPGRGRKASPKHLVFDVIRILPRSSDTAAMTGISTVARNRQSGHWEILLR